MGTRKVKRRRFNFLKFLIFLLFLYLIVFGIIRLLSLPIKNIIILGNNRITETEIINTSKIGGYPSLFKTMSFNIEKRLKTLPLVKEVKVKKRLGYKLIIEVEEYKIIYRSRSDNKYTLENKESIELSNNIDGVPVLINYTPEDKNDKLILKMSLIDENIISKISEIEYSPTSYDDERFILYMKDKNMVYITLNKIKELNKYISVVKKLDGHTGILYLDSGNYFEIKD
ncbi:MAG: FtsQ-type POTRA domain-containing protein [Bacilli bacterium]